MKVKIEADEMYPVYIVQTWATYRKGRALKGGDFPADMNGVVDIPDWIVAEIRRLDDRYERLQKWLENYKNTKAYHASFCRIT